MIHFKINHFLLSIIHNFIHNFAKIKNISEIKLLDNFIFFVILETKIMENQIQKFQIFPFSNFRQLKSKDS